MIGTQLGPYQILEEIGKGGMATVYRAYQPGIDRQVAIKVIHQLAAANPQVSERFRREARIIARLEHPNILPIYDFDGSHDPPYIVMRYLRHGTLEDILQKHSPSPASTLPWLRQVAAGLDYAHRQGVIHRDVKPSNVMLDGEGNAVVCDFGIARLANPEKPEEVLTEHGSVIGTVYYMAPEQVMGSRYDYRADLYSLGVVMFEMLTGRLPFLGGDTMSVLMKHIGETPPGPSSLNPNLSSAVDEVLLRVLAKKPEERYASARDAVEALAAAMATGSPAPALPGISLSAPSVSGEAPTVPPLKRTPTEQNRIITALQIDAADYAGWVEAQEGPEAARDAVEAFWEAAGKTIEQYGGQLYDPAGVNRLALWGVEWAHEDDAERAVRAGLAVRDGLLRGLHRDPSAALEGGPPPLNIGVHTGLALVTPLETGGGCQVSGTTLSVAARLADTADGCLLISPDTLQSIGDRFETEIRPPVRVPGHPARMDVYQVNAARPRAFHPGLRGIGGAAARVTGREIEIKQIQEAYLTAVEDGETQSITLVGEAGIGKSRLLWEYDRWAEISPYPTLTLRGRAAPGMPPYGLLRDLFFSRFEIYDGDPTQTACAKFEQGFARLLPQSALEKPPVLPLVGQMIGLDFSADPFVRSMLQEPQHLAAESRRAFTRLMIGLCAVQPVVIELDDLQHADEPSLQLLNELVQANAGLKLLLIAAARPGLFEGFPGWGAGRGHIRMDLRPLTRRECAGLAGEILRRVPALPRALVDLLVSRSEGNPYYLEELIKSLIENHIILTGETPDQPWRVEETRLARLTLPPTLVALLQSRVDCLFYPELLALQRASVLGKVFWDRAVQSLESADGAAIDLHEALAALAQRRFIIPHELGAFEGCREYAFEQSLVRDLVYTNLGQRQRRAYHAAAASWLAASAENGSDQSIAEHWLQAGEPLQAAGYLLKAARWTYSVCACGYSEAIAQTERALSLVSSTDPEPGDGFEQRRLRLETLLLLSEILSRKGDYAAAGLRLRECLDLARRSGDLRSQASALGQLGRVELWRGDLPESLAVLEEALTIIRGLDDPPTLAFILRQLGNTCNSTGDFERADLCLNESLEISRAISDPEIEMAALNSLASTARNQGDFPRAIQRLQEGLNLARKLGDLRLVPTLLVNLANTLADIRDYEGAQRCAQEALEEEKSSGLLTGGSAIAYGILAEAALAQGSLDDARFYSRESLRLRRDLGGQPLVLSALFNYAKLFAMSTAPAQAVRAIELLGLIQSHPASLAHSRRKVDQVLGELCAAAPLSACSASEIQSALARGAVLDLDALVVSLIENQSPW